jgi:hypothetical protein
MRYAIIILLTFLSVAGCNGRSSSSSPVVREFGSSTSPDGSKKLEVTRREKSLVDFKVLESTAGKQLVSDYIGSDAMRWFLYWETSARLWGYGSDIGYFKLFEFKPDGTVTETSVNEKMSLPPIVWENLPSSLQRKYKMHNKP